MSSSEIARLREQLRSEYESAKNSLEGLGMVARHDFISKRQHNIETCFNQLIQHMSPDMATRLLMEVERQVYR